MSHEPKKKHSTQRKGKRRASIHLDLVSGINCKNCNAVNPSHQVCKSCGFYNGKQIVKVTGKTIVKRRTVTEK